MTSKACTAYIFSDAEYLHFTYTQVNVSDGNKMLQLIRWFQSAADPKYRVFLIGGVPSRWRELSDDSRTGAIWQRVYETLDAIHPWHVGRWSSIHYGNWYYNERIAKDAARCSELGILYMPTMCKFKFTYAICHLNESPPYLDVPLSARLHNRARIFYA